MKRLELTLGPEAARERADRALARAFPEVAGWRLREAFGRRDVKRNGQRIRADTMVSPGDVLHLFVPGTQPDALIIVFEDEDYVIVNKRQGVATQGEGSVEACYARQTGRAACACHRLDVQTGGLLLLAKGEAARLRAERAFAAHALEKTYQAVVKGCPAPPEATLHAYLRKDAKAAKVWIGERPAAGAQPIETRYRTLACQGETARLEVRLVTGRTHQIRAHLAYIGHPVLGDDKYGDRAFNRAQGAKRQRLWAVRLVLWDGRAFAVEPDF